jgi:hypothetical protein
MPFHPDILILDEWVALIQQDSAQAKQHLIVLKARNKQQGLFADPSLEISIEDYGRAQALLASPDVPQERIAKLVKLGEFTMRPLPDRAGWQALIEEDAAFAHQAYLAIMTKMAMLGVSAPQEIHRSIKAYEDLTKSTA